MTRAARYGWWAVGLACAAALLVALLVGRPFADGGTPAAEESPAVSEPSASPAPSSAAEGPTADSGDEGQDAGSGAAGAEGDAAPGTATAPAPSSETAVVPASLPVLPTVPVGTTADYGTGVSASVESVTRIDAIGGRARGEIGGPSVVITVRVQNTSDAPVSLDSLVVDLYGADGRLGLSNTEDPHGSPASGTLAPGAETTASYVSSLPDPASEQITIVVSYTGQIPAAVFEGSVPR